MVLKSYLFSSISGNWQQYTTDHTEELFKLMCKSCTSQNQIAVHREGNLMCYVYIRKHKDSYIGLSIVCGEVCNDLLWMRDSFQAILEDAAHKGVLFCYDAKGNLIKSEKPFASEAAETDNLFRTMKQYFEDAQSKWEALPSEDFSIPKESKMRLAFDEDSKEKLTDALRHYHNVVVTMENTVPSSYAQTVKRLSDYNQRLKNEKAELKKQVAEISEQKKRSTIVAVLAFLLIICGGVAYVMYGNVKTQKGELANKEKQVKKAQDARALAQSEMAKAQKEKEVVQKQIKSLQSEKQKMQTEIEDMRNERERLQNEKERIQNERNSYERQVRKLQNAALPLEITKIEIANAYNGGAIETNYGRDIYSSNTMYLKPKIYYNGNRFGSITLKVKWFKPDGSLATGDSSPAGFSQKESVNISTGSNTYVLRGWGNENKGFWGKGRYRIEIWYDDMCLKSKTFTIY